jgi:hypothetical protein
MVLLGAGPLLRAADADKGVQQTLTDLLSAIQANDRDTFLAQATEAMKKGMTSQLMDKVSREFGSRFAKGYQAQYLCRLNQKGLRVYLWKITFKAGGDDLVARLAMDDGKVAGFFLE